MRTVCPGAPTVIIRVPPGSRTEIGSSRRTAPRLDGGNRRCACAGAACLGPARAALEHVEPHRAPFELGHEADVHALGEMRVALNLGAEPQPLVADLVEGDGVGVAHRDAAQAQGLTTELERMVEPGLVGAQRQVARHQRRRRHLNGDRFRASAVHDEAGMRPGQGVDAHLERRLTGAARQMQGGAANPVAAHLGDRAIGVDDIHPRRFEVEDQHSVSAYAAVPIAKRNRPLGRKPHAAERFLLDDQEVVPKTFVLVERQRHGESF